MEQYGAHGASLEAVKFPDGKRFAFSILDETDVSANSGQPVYALLQQLGMRTTKTVWPLARSEGSHVADSAQTLADPGYRESVLALRDHGFEIGWQGASMESSKRERTIEGLERFRDIVGAYPRLHANYPQNRESLYWGPNRVDQPLLRAVVQRADPTPTNHSLGHMQNTPFYWGDVCHRRIDYVKNLTFNEVNLARVNASMPYHDPQRPLVRWWFSCSEAQDCAAFAHLLRPERQDRLERDGGWCIVATHFAHDFVRSGGVDRLAARRLEMLASRNGWFVPVSTLLDYLRDQRADNGLSAAEWDRMQWRWARELVRRRVKGQRGDRDDASDLVLST